MEEGAEVRELISRFVFLIVKRWKEGDGVLVV